MGVGDTQRRGTKNVQFITNISMYLKIIENFVKITVEC